MMKAFFIDKPLFFGYFFLKKTFLVRFMQITRSEEYGLRGLVFLAKQPPEKVTLVSEVSREQNIPETFLAKIFQRLSKAGLLRSVRGANGGFTLRKPAHEITMREIIEALEGPIALNRCLLRKGECEEEKICPLHTVWEEVQQRFLEILDNTTMEDLANRMTRDGKKGRR
jgi:Rrf2 family transcriptional regulator, iron-sulfur cluster assembly transcription factor